MFILQKSRSQNVEVSKIIYETEYNLEIHGGPHFLFIIFTFNNSYTKNYVGQFKKNKLLLNFYY